MPIRSTKPSNTTAFSIGNLDVWTVRLDRAHAQSDQLDQLYETLSPAERERADRFRFNEPRHQFVVTRAALRRLLGDYLGLSPSTVTFETNPHGKPRLAHRFHSANLRFNVAHSAAVALIAITTDCEIGVDVERVRTVNHQEHIAQRYFHPAESGSIVSAHASMRDLMFLRCWTGKEAVLKAIGSGITGSLPSFHVPTSEFGHASIDLPAPFFGDHSQCWLHELLPCEAYVGAVAYLGEKRSVRCFAFDP